MRTDRRNGKARRDHGSSLIEVLIAIVLLGTGVTAMLSSLATTVVASATERDHANAHAWLQSATDVLYGEPRVDCDDPGLEAIYAGILETAKDPEGWWEASNRGKIELVSPVLFWDGDIYQSTCYDNEGLGLQLVTIRVRSSDGTIVESVEVVKG